MSNRWKIAAVLVAIAIAVALIAWFIAVSPSASDLTAKAEQLLAKGDNEQAEALSRMALAKQPASIAATRVNILASIRMQKYEPARTRLTSLRDGDDKSAVLLEASREFLQQGRLTDALEFLPADYNHEIGDANESLRIEIASLVGDRVTLLKLYHQAAAVPLRKEIISAYEQTKRTGQELEIINRGANTAPPDALALTALAIHKERAGQRNEADELAEKALRIDPTILSAIEVRARSLADSASDREWEIFVLRLPSAALESPAIWETFGDRCVVTQEYNQAARCYYESIYLRDDSPSACLSLIEVLKKTNGHELIVNVASIARNPSSFFANDKSRLAPLKPLAGNPLPEWVIQRQKQRRKNDS